MDKKTLLNDQEAPEKNTDNAFVQVGENGKPELPSQTDNKKSNDNNSASAKPEEGTLEDR